ncbi:MAG: hypothetical protein CVU30_08805 [Betaproteobacteria bacterium HGW-Betaproteobacteria-3]|nr:MAG: hypothetical protein CVU30_08805 [Betaproteobacteria bacterium HGW-Betaproteobacteria-3]
MKFSPFKILAVAAFAVLPMLASAQLSSNVSVTTNYKFRGQDQDTLSNSGGVKSRTFKPALQGGFDYAFASGLYVGNWNSSVNWLPGNSIEMDFYGGYKGEIMKDLGFDVGAITYQYPGNSDGKTTELYAGLSYGPVSAKYSRSVSNDYFFYGSKAGYLNLAYAQEIVKGVTLKASVGATQFTKSANQDFVDYSVGAAYDLGEGFSLSGSLTGASQKSFYGSPNKSRVIVAISKSM